MLEAGVAERLRRTADCDVPEPASRSEPSARLVPRRGRLAAVVVTMRPRQWVKNALVIAAAGAAGALGRDDVPLRVGVAAPVRLSRWCLLVVTFAAIFVAAGKRWAELRRIEPGLRGRRRVLALYTEARLRVILAVSAAGAFIAYSFWAFWIPTVHGV